MLGNYFGSMPLLQIVEEHVRRTLPPPAGWARSPEHNDYIAQLHETVHPTPGALQYTRLFLLASFKLLAHLLIFIRMTGMSLDLLACAP